MGIAGRAPLALALLPLAATLAAAWPATIVAQTRYPERPVRIVLPMGPGTPADLTMRLVSEKLGAKLGQRFMVENMPGAGGIAAAHAVLTAPADGYTITILTNSTAISVPLFKKLPYDPLKDFVPISSIGYFDCVFVTNAGSDYRTLGDFLAAARAKPGTLNIGTINVGSTQHLAAELLKALAGANFVVIPFRTSAEAVAALTRNDVQMVVDFPALLKAELAAHKVTPVAATGPVSARLLGRLPTVAEAGVPGYEAKGWDALYAPATTPKEDIAVLNAALRDVLGDAEVKQHAADLGIEARAATSAEVDAQMRGDIEKWRWLIAQANIGKQ